MNHKTPQEEVRDNIITLFEIDKLPEGKREETIGTISRIIFQAVLARVLPMLEEEDLARYDKLIEENAAPDEVLDFFFEKVPSFLGIIAEETEGLRREAGEVLRQM